MNSLEAQWAKMFMGIAGNRNRAIAFAAKAHDLQLDKSNCNFLDHPLRVMLAVVYAGYGSEYGVAAVLHDVVEDTDVTLDNIYEEFGEFVCNAVDALTHREGEPYFDYIKRVKKDKIARVVKLYDLRDNMDISRFNKKLGHGIYSRYAKAYGMLLED